MVFRKVKILVVDDEPLARQRITNLLKNNQYVESLEECKNGAEAIKEITGTKPDIVFLDIQMPDKTGFEVIKSLFGAHVPQIVFVTAYDQYALQAFEVNAIDYLLKPYDDIRFNEAFEKALNQLSLEKMRHFNHKLTKLVDFYFAEDLEYVFEVKHDGWLQRISHKDVSHIEALGNYIKIHTEKKYYLDRRALSSIMNELNKTSFFRIHRSFLVNKEYIENIVYKGNNEYKIRLKTGQSIISGRAFKGNIVEYLELINS